jgi:hypothetical protein
MQSAANRIVTAARMPRSRRGLLQAGHRGTLIWECRLSCSALGTLFFSLATLVIFTLAFCECVSLFGNKSPDFL